MNTSKPLPVDVPFFRSLMRCLASSVVVVTGAYDGRLAGMTATAVCSVCAEPPTILIVVNRSARSHALFADSGAFVVNILSDAQKNIAERFAQKLDDQFSGFDTILLEEGPVFRDVAAHLACRVVDAINIGTHTVFVALVVGGDTSERLPLLFHTGRYATLWDAV